MLYQPTTTNTEVSNLDLSEIRRTKAIGPDCQLELFVLKWNEKPAINSINPGENSCKFY